MEELIKKIGSKNLILIAIAFIIITICLVTGSLLYYNFFYKKTFPEIETIMTTAAKKYYNQNKDELPNTPGQSTEIKIDKLISREYMKSIQDYVKNEDVACKGSVNVTNINNKYRYTPLLDCGRYYSYETIAEHIKEKEQIVTESDGLYELNNELVYRGEKLNNYVKLSDHLWRIIKIKDDKLVLIYNEKTESTSWDDRYNNDKEYNIGFNNYKISRIKDYLDNLYKGTTILNSKSKLLVSPHSAPIGKINETDDDKSGQLENAEMLDNQYLSLLPMYDYINASLDSNCKTPTNISCTNYNYLSNYDYDFWSITANKKTSYEVYEIVTDIGGESHKAASYGYVRPVITIVKDAIYVKGNGTITKPYEFK